MRQQLSIDGGWIQRNLLIHKQIAILAGAGISRQAGLPIVTDLVSAVLRSLDAPSALAERVPELPFEVFMYVLGRHSQIEPLLAIYADGRPNTNHAFLAHALRRSVITDVCTTNFDCLIERAYSDPAANCTSPLTVLRTSKDLEREVWNNARVRLTKIHGCSSDQREVAITIEQVAGRIHSEPRAAAMEHLFATGDHDVVLILGYSCSDAWDLSPQIEDLAARGKTVYIVEHTNGLGGAIEVELIGERRSRNPFRAYPHGYRIYADTDRFVRLLWEELVPDREYFPPEKQETPWLASVQMWASALSPFAAGLIRGHLFTLLGMPAESVQEFEWLETAEREMTGEIAVSLSNQVGSLLEMGEAERAAEICQTAVAAFRRLGMKEALGNQLGWLGNCMNQLRRPEEALTYFSEAADILGSVDDRLGVGNQLGNIANALGQLGRYEEAVVEYQRSLRIAEEIGNVSGVINQLIGLSQTHLELGRPKEALEYSRLGERTAHAFKSRKQHAQLASLSGAATQRLGGYSETIRHWEDAIALAREEGDARFLSTYLIEAARDFLKLGNWGYVVSYAREAQSLAAGADNNECQYLIALAQTKSGQIADAQSCLEGMLDDLSVTGDPSRMVSVLQALGDLHVNKAAPTTAIGYFQRALALRDGHNVRNDLSGVEASLGRALLLANDPAAARPHVESALEWATQSGDISTQSSCHQLLSWLHRDLHQLKDARRHAELALEMAEATENHEMVVWALADLGTINMMSGQWGYAFEEFSAGVRLSQDIELPTGIMSHRRYLGKLLGFVGMEEYGIAELIEARKLLVELFGAQDPDMPELDAEIRQVTWLLEDHERKRFLQTWAHESPFVATPAVLKAGPAFYTHLQEIDEAPPDLQFYWGRFLYYQKEYQSAMVALSGCLQGDRGLDVTNYLGNLYYISGQRREALDHYARVLTLDPGHQNASFMAGLCCKDLGQVSESARYYTQVTSMHPHYEDALFNLGLCAVEMEDLGSARQHFESFLKINGTDPEAWSALANISAAAGDLDHAEFAIKQALAFGSDPASIETLAKAIKEARGGSGTNGI